MYLQALDLKDFYETTLGRIAQRLIRVHLRRLWPSTRGLSVLGFGYTLPFLRPWLGEARQLAALMPDQMGAVFWPPEGPGRVVLADSQAWPVETASVDRLLVVHAFESYEHADAVLKEAWRVLAGQGRLVVVVPNRSGLWARFDSTPFGHGNSYSLGQVRGMLRDYQFVTERAERALFVPPLSSRVLLSLSVLLEKIGGRFFNAFGGVMIVEASKQLYGATPVGATATRADRPRRFLTSPRPLSRVNKT